LNSFSKYGLVVLFGVMFALCLYPILLMNGRWFYVIIAALLMLSISMLFISRFSEFIFIVFMFALPLAGFNKWLFIKHYSKVIFQAAPLSGAIGIGLIDFLIIGLYLTWFSRIFITREKVLPRFQKIDWLIVSFIGANLISLWGTPDVKLGLYAVVHLIKHVMIYFYVSRHFKLFHVPWFFAAVFFAIFFESVIGIMQSLTGMFRGLILDKGAGSDQLNYQYAVPGIEGLSRSTGTSYDSHSLALYLCMLLPYPFVFSFYSQYVRWPKRIVSGLFFIIGMLALITTYSRSGWLSAAISLSLAVIVFLKWREKYIVLSIVLMFLVLMIPAPWAIDRIYERFVSAPPEIMTARYDQFTVALNIWMDNPFFGFGIGNYLKALEIYNTNWSLNLPVHNVFLWVAADTGLLGVVTYYGIIIAALRRLWILIRKHRHPGCRIALAVFTGLIAYMLDGLTNPLFRESVVYMMFWFSVALSVAMTRIYLEKEIGTTNTITVRE